MMSAANRSDLPSSTSPVRSGTALSGQSVVAKLAKLAAALLMGQALGLNARAATPADLIQRPHITWKLVKLKPTYNPGFLLIPDDSEPGDVFACVGADCGLGQDLCTMRVFPEKPEIWKGMATSDLLRDFGLSVVARLGFIDEDVERLTGLVSGNVGSLLNNLDRFPGILDELDGRSVIITDFFFDNGPNAPRFVTAAWLDQARLHRIICTAPTAEEVASKRLLRDFMSHL